MKTTSLFVIATAACLLVPTASKAAIVVQYQTAASETNAELSADIADPSISAGPMAAGSGIAAAAGSTWNWNNWGNAGVPNASYEAAVADNNFWAWGFNVVENVTIGNMTMDIRLDRSGTGPNQVEIRAAVNSGAPVSLLTFNYGDDASGVDFTDVDLSGLGTLVQGDSVEFVLAAWGEDSGGSSEGGTFDLETVDFGGSDPRSNRINGDVVAIPEPGSSALAFLAVSIGTVTVGRRRR